MGYAGYVPAKMPPGNPTAVQAALWSIRSRASLETLEKLLRNAAVSPKEEKYRSLRLSNPKVKTLILDEPGALDAMLVLGWERHQSDSELLVIGKGRYFTMAEVRLVQESIERLKKSAQDLQRVGAAMKLPSGTEQQRIRQQMEADRLERAARAS